MYLSRIVCCSSAEKQILTSMNLENIPWGPLSKIFYFSYLVKNFTLRITAHWNSCVGLIYLIMPTPPDSSVKEMRHTQFFGWRLCRGVPLLVVTLTDCQVFRDSSYRLCSFSGWHWLTRIYSMSQKYWMEQYSTMITSLLWWCIYDPYLLGINILHSTSVVKDMALNKTCLDLMLLKTLVRGNISYHIIQRQTGQVHRSQYTTRLEGL